jgi:cytochrome c oxidase cbb3-type subunit 3
MRPFRHIRAILFILVTLASCKREDRGFRVDPPSARPGTGIVVSDLHAGAFPSPSPVQNDYEHNAYALSEGKRLYQYFNCSGCHFNGGGGIGPPLMDDKWIYGSNPENIHATIIEGRPNGMPSYRGKIPDYQVWQIVAYVRSLGGLTPSTPANGRSDHMQVKKPEQSMPPQTPKNSFTPPGTQMP